MRFWSSRGFWLSLLAAHLLFLRPGLWSNDEAAYLTLARSLVDRFPWELHEALNLSPYIPAPGHGAYYSFFEFGGEVHAGISPGMSLLSAPMYALMGSPGMKLLSICASMVTAYTLYRLLRPHNGAGRLAAVLYVFATPAIFYATSLWYHSLLTMLFTLSVYFVLEAERQKNAHIILPVLCALSVLCAFYILPSVFILMAGGALRLGRRRGTAALVLFLLLLTPALAYNLANFGSLLGEHSVPSPLLSAAGGNAEALHPAWARVVQTLPALLLIPELSESRYALVQKGMLQSSPVLALGLVYLLRRRLAVPVLAGAVLVLQVAYASGDLGGWELSMRYLLPLYPVLCVATAEFLRDRRIAMPHAEGVLLALAFLLMLFPLDIPSPWYTRAKAAAAFLAVAAVILSLSRLGQELRAAAVLLLLFSAFLNLNDASYSASYRSAHALIDGALSDAGSVILAPEGAPFAGLFLPGRELRSYSAVPPNLSGRLTLIGYSPPENCRVESQWGFSSPYSHLVRAHSLRRLVDALQGMRVYNLSCAGNGV
ncbi:MAG: hypothetical protein GXN98_00170 [Euryarchaeota archaeon]|nr:hypothetical protein [Euryarchaeota archaeon]